MVMVVFPVVFNAFQFWFLDNILKLPDEKAKEINTFPEDDTTTSNIKVDDDEKKSDIELDNPKTYIPPPLNSKKNEELPSGNVQMTTDRSTEGAKSYESSSFSEIPIGSIGKNDSIN